jgi:hypothetical protein
VREKEKQRERSRDSKREPEREPEKQRKKEETQTHTHTPFAGCHAQQRPRGKVQEPQQAASLLPSCGSQSPLLHKKSRREETKSQRAQLKNNDEKTKERNTTQVRGETDTNRQTDRGRDRDRETTDRQTDRQTQADLTERVTHRSGRS